MKTKQTTSQIENLAPDLMAIIASFEKDFATELDFDADDDDISDVELVRFERRFSR